MCLLRHGTTMTTRKALPERKDPQKTLNRQNTHTTRVGRHTTHVSQRAEATASKQARCLPRPACCSIYGDTGFCKERVHRCWMERRGAFVRWSGPMALGVEQARPPPPIGARSPFQRPPGAPRGLLMAVPKWASTGLGWGGGLSRLRTRSAAPWAWVSTPKLPLGGIQHCQPASSSSSRAVL